MKKAATIKKLEIAKETLHRLDNKDLLQAAGGGGGWSADSVCPTTTPSDLCP